MIGADTISTFLEGGGAGRATNASQDAEHREPDGVANAGTEDGDERLWGAFKLEQGVRDQIPMGK